MTAVKICGLQDTATVRAAIDADADFLGFVFHPPSPRNISAHTAANLRQITPAHVKTVGLFVDPTDAQLKKFAQRLRIDMIQLHGNETPARVAAIREKFALPVIKAIQIRTEQDLSLIPAFEETADWLLFDSGTGGTGKTFDWNLLSACRFKKPWMLSGGLHAGNVGDALRVLRPDAVDVSSGVEISRGVKSIEKIREFIAAAKTA